MIRRGKPVKVIKIATDITSQKLKAAEDAGKLDALSRAQAIIEFKPKGEVLAANENFLSVLGYSLSDIRGKHYFMFCDQTYTTSAAYKEFWTKLAGGELTADEFMRIGKGGRKVFIQASYNPIFDEAMPNIRARSCVMRSGPWTRSRLVARNLQYYRRHR